MIINKTDKSRIVIASILLTIIAFSMFFQYPWFQNQLIGSKNDGSKFSENDRIRSSETDYYNKEWITNGDFSAGSVNWSSEILGDTSDFNLGINSGTANYEVQGERKTFSLSENPIDGSNWLNVPNPDFPTGPEWPYGGPAVYSDSEGLKVSHEFSDTTANQNPSTHWDRNITMQEDMSDYLITSASIQAVVNATVDRNVDVQADDIPNARVRSDGHYLTYNESFDYVRFYVLISDLNKNRKYEIAYNQTTDLGYGDAYYNPGEDYLYDTVLTSVPEDVLIFYLSSVLNTDHHNFTLTLGIRIYTADNSNEYDTDTFDELLIKSVNLTFTYEKKINQLDRASWKQDGALVPDNYVIENATLNFKYMINASWSEYTSSPNSEFRIMINNNQLGETVNLNSANGTLRYIKDGGFDVTSFIMPNKPVNLSIQVYIGDEFLLNSTIKVTIDDVSLIIGYGIYTPPDTTSYDLLLNDIDRTTEKSTQVTYGENLNVTFVYKNSTGDFIPGADVYLSGGGLPLTPLNPDLINEQYYKIIDTTDLGVGTSYLTLSASKRYHTPQEFQISVTVTNRDTELQLFLNGANETINKETTIAWNENLNITIKYMDLDNTPKTHISSANVELTGAGPTKIFSENGGNEQYNYTINSNILGVGSTFLTAYASKDNYTSLNIRFKVTVITRSTYLDNIELNNTETKSIEIEWNELFDVSVIYRDFNTTNPITGATVQLIGTNYSEILSPSGNLYTWTVDTFDLSIGNNFLTLLAQKDNYTIASELITVTVNERATSIDTILNHTSTTAISFPFGELLNITAVYNDHSGPFIDGAIVELREGASVLHILPKTTGINQYSYTFNTNELSIGVNLLTIYAKKDNYTAAFASITVTINERDTSLEIYLDGAMTTVVEKEYDESLNITVVYKDFTDAFIDNAVCELRRGETILYTLPKDLSYLQYEQVINTKDLDLGTNLLAIYANQDNYTALLVSITVIVSEKGTSLDTILDDNPGTTVEVIYGEYVNITAIYKENMGTFIDGATVELRKGANVLEPLIEGTSQYSISIDSNRLTLGGNILSIYAYKTNYSVALVTILIVVNERDTTLDVSLDGINSDTFEFYNVSITDSIDIVAIYNDFEDNFISGAAVELTGSGMSEPLNPGIGQYTYTLDALSLGIGVHFLVISASHENYTVSIKNIKLNVLERNSTLQLLIDDVDITDSRYVATEIDKSLNITVFFTDPGDSSYISNADIRLTGALEANFTENIALEQYNVSLDTNSLQQGINFLTIFAQKANYQSRSLIFTIEVQQKNSTLDLLVDDVDLTDTRYIATEINKVLNITVFFTVPDDGSHISNAEIRLTGALEINFTENLALAQYNISLDTDSLQQGINFLTIFAQKANYQSRSLIFTIEVKQKNSTLDLLVDDVDLTESRYIATEIDKILNITVFFTIPDDGSHISGANIRLTGALEVNFTENVALQQYNVSLDTNNLQQGINFLTIFAQKANYQSRSLIFTIEVKQKNTTLQVILNDEINPVDNSIKVTIGDPVNVTVIYMDDAMNFIDNASIIIVGEGINQTGLSKDLVYNQYNVTIDTLDLNFGINLLTLYAQKANYQPQTLIIRIEINEKETDMDVYLNDILQPQQDRSINLPIKALLNITVKYFENDTGHLYIPGSVIQLVGEGLTDYYFTEYASLEQYSISINTTLLDIGVRFLTIYATHANFQSYSALLRIQVDRIKTNITTTAGEIVFNREPGDNFKLELQLRDTDFKTNVLNANVSYTWVYGQGSLSDPDNDGTYSATLTNLREGTFQITITVYAGDDYDFERFFVTLNVIRPPEDVLLFQILTIAGIAAAVGISAYLIAYQRVLKYPKQVRKIRKFKKKLKKTKASGIETLSRDEIIDKNYAEKIHPLEKQIKGKIAPKSTEGDLSEDKIESSENLDSQ